MKEQSISAKKHVKDDNGQIVETLEGSATLQEPESFEEMKAMWGEDSMFKATLANVRLDFQAAIRRLLVSGTRGEALEQKLAGWKPGVVVEKEPTDPVELLLSKWDTLSDEQKARILSRAG